jgi:chromosome condensin MukBEF ATPase and DNA-binding subunit MukB
LYEVFLALVTTVAYQDQARVEQLSTLDGMVLAMDGVQPEKSHETLDIWREVRSGRVVVAKTRLSSATAEMERLIEEVLS